MVIQVLVVQKDKEIKLKYYFTKLSCEDPFTWYQKIGKSIRHWIQTCESFQLQKSSRITNQVFV